MNEKSNFSLLLEKLNSNIDTISKKSKEIRCEVFFMFLSVFVYAMIFLAFTSLILTYIISRDGVFLPKDFFYNFLLNTLCLIILVTVFITYVKHSSVKTEDQTFTELLDEFKRKTVGRSGNTGKIFKYLYNLGIKIDYLTTVSEAILAATFLTYSMFWMSLSHSEDEEYEEVRTKFFNLSIIPDAFKDLFSETEKELYDFSENAKDKTVIEKYINFSH